MNQASAAGLWPQQLSDICNMLDYDPRSHNPFAAMCHASLHTTASFTLCYIGIPVFAAVQVPLESACLHPPETDQHKPSSSSCMSHSPMTCYFMSLHSMLHEALIFD